MAKVIKRDPYYWFFLCVQLAAISVFLGRAWQHLYWDAPYRSLFWDENWMRFVVEGLFGYEWSAYVRNPSTDVFIQRLIQFSGVVYLLAGLVAVFIRHVPRWLGKLLLVGASLLVFLAFLYMKEKWFHIGQFLEYALQITAPVFLYLLAFREQQPSRKLILAMKIAIAATFVCHGLYAVGYYPQPGTYVQMCISILGISEAQSVMFLQVMGVLDFVAAVCLFFPRPVLYAALGYCVVWGAATALARIWSNFYLDFWSESLLQYAHLALMRGAHFLVPLSVLIYEWRRGERTV